MAEALSRAAREAGARIIAALATRFRDLDIAEEAFADACAKAAEAWPRSGVPDDPAAWLYRVAERRGLDAVRKRTVRERLVPEAPKPEPTAEDILMDDASLIPDERLRLIFVCCHPAVAAESRAALTLRLVCGLSTAEIAHAFLVAEPTLAQRLVRAKRKIAEAGVPFEIPGPRLWAERLDSVLSTLEIAYSKAHEDAASAGPHWQYAAEMLDLTRLLAELVPNEAEVLSLAATVRFAEARRSARVDPSKMMVPLSEQDPDRWNRELIAEAAAYLSRACEIDPGRPRVLQAAIHGTWCARTSLAYPPPWPKILAIYDLWLPQGEHPIVRLNRAVALAEVENVQAALDEVERLDDARMQQFLPYHAVRADLLRRLGRKEEARLAYEAALALGPGPAEGRWLTMQLQS